MHGCELIGGDSCCCFGFCVAMVNNGDEIKDHILTHHDHKNEKEKRKTLDVAEEISCSLSSDRCDGFVIATYRLRYSLLVLCFRLRERAFSSLFSCSDSSAFPALLFFLVCDVVYVCNNHFLVFSWM